MHGMSPARLPCTAAAQTRLILHPACCMLHATPYSLQPTAYTAERVRSTRWSASVQAFEDLICLRHGRVIHTFVCLVCGEIQTFVCVIGVYVGGFIPLCVSLAGDS